jgi:hypothetical protein
MNHRQVLLSTLHFSIYIEVWPACDEEFYIAASRATLLETSDSLYKTATVIFTFIEGVQDTNNLSRAWIRHNTGKDGPEIIEGFGQAVTVRPELGQYRFPQ